MSHFYLCACIYVGGPTVGYTRYSFFRQNYILKVECVSMGSIPTNVIWLMNNTVVDISCSSYQTMQSVASHRFESHMRNILLVNDRLVALESQTYTCIVENTFGSDSEEVNTHSVEGKCNIYLVN